MSEVPTEKLQKVLARVGLGARRTMEGWITLGKVRVNGRIAVLGDRVQLTDEVLVDGKRIDLQAAPTETQVLCYHKPIGEVSTRSDEKGRPTVFDHLPPLPQGRWINIGRLDLQTSGLLLFTNDGDLAHRCMHPSTEITREYHVRIDGTADARQLAALRNGVVLDDGLAAFDTVDRLTQEGGRNQWYSVTLKEGRNREVRRLWESQNLQVNRLIRTKFGSVTLPEDMPLGNYFFLSKPELARFMQDATAASPQ